jgi:hypothetical protein
MSAETVFDARHEEYARYRSLSLAAVTTLVFGIISTPALIFRSLLILPLIGLVIAFFAFRVLRRNSFELGGLWLARIGLGLCVMNFLAGSTRATIEYLTEVPEGYQRISFRELQPDSELSSSPVPPRAVELNGRKVFVKGYIYPDDRSSQLKKFVLVPDMGTCCFGGQPKLTDMIEVTLKRHPGVRFSYQCRKLAGVLHVDTKLKEISGLQGVYYQLEADYVK